MRTSILKLLAVIITILTFVWLLIGKPDRSAEQLTLKQEVAAEADLRSQALTFAMDKYRQATVLLARTDIVASIVENNSGEYKGNLDRLFYLQALSGVSSMHVLKKDSAISIPEVTIPANVSGSESWRSGIDRAFRGSLGRTFYNNANARPIYVFFAPVPSRNNQVNAILIVKIDLGLVRDSWQVSPNHISIHGDNGDLWFDNGLPIPTRAISIDRTHAPMTATLTLSTQQPPWHGRWMLRSLILSLLLLLGGVMAFSLVERRRFLSELAQQRAGEAQRLEHEVQQRTTELKKVQKQLILSEKLALLGQMSASISHEINQPLAAIKNYATSARRLAERQETARLPATLKNIEQLCDRVSRIVVNLRSFASNEPGTLQSIPLTPLLQEALNEFYDRYPTSTGHCTLEASTSNLKISAGHVRLLQVLGNLLTNAWLACRDQNPPSIRVAVTHNDNNVEIRVKDNGPGIDSNLSPHVFDAFFTHRNDDTGLGLGLTISRTFIQSMGGDLKIENSSPSGTTFVISLNQKPA